MKSLALLLLLASPLSAQVVYYYEVPTQCCPGGQCPIQQGYDDGWQGYSQPQRPQRPNRPQRPAPVGDANTPQFEPRPVPPKPTLPPPQVTQEPDTPTKHQWDDWNYKLDQLGEKKGCRCDNTELIAAIDKLKDAVEAKNGCDLTTTNTSIQQQTAAITQLTNVVALLVDKEKQTPPSEPKAEHAPDAIYWNAVQLQ